MDVSRADGELRCPMAGEGQHVTVAQPMGVKTKCTKEEQRQKDR